MEISQFKRSMQEIARSVSALVEEKLGERSQLEEQVRGVAKHVERVVSETLWNRGRETVEIRFQRLAHFKGDLPAYATLGASGMDVRACIDSDLVIQPMGRTLVPTGLSLEIPFGYEVQARPRSGLAIKQGLTLLNTPGTVDSDYRGELKIILINLGQEPVTIKDQDRIAQLVLCPVIHCEIKDATDLSATERGEGGFGSTGVS